MAATAEKVLPEETVANLFGPAVILPAQFTEQMGAKQSDRGEKRLMLAVLEEAVATLPAQRRREDPTWPACLP